MCEVWGTNGTQSLSRGGQYNNTYNTYKAANSELGNERFGQGLAKLWAKLDSSVLPLDEVVLLERYVPSYPGRTGGNSFGVR